MRQVTKEIFLGATACLAQGWFLRHAQTTEPPSVADLFRMEQGAEVGKLAHQLLPTGILVPPGQGDKPAHVTQKLMADPKIV